VASAEAIAAAAAQVYAGPAVRKMARELGVDLSQVAASGPRGRMVKDDVSRYVKQRLTSAPAPVAAIAAEGGSGIPPIPLVDFAKFGPVEEVKLPRVQRAGGVNLHRSWLNLPHVTHFDEADITDLELFRKSIKDDAQKAGARITPLAFIVKACARALVEFPKFNCSLGPNKDTLVLKRYYNIGVAVDTENGLVVPVVKDVDRKGVYEIAREVVDLSDRARAGKLKPDEMSGGTFSITSLGVLGGTGFTPIINAPEVAILGVAKLATKPVWNGAAFVPREMLPLCLSYDHRVINGADGARFTTYLMALLADMRRLLL
jgi:pyruvate dehydrogenase E2 component (dihydrolipoamide acetyltransferase)